MKIPKQLSNLFVFYSCIFLAGISATPYSEPNRTTDISTLLSTAGPYLEISSPLPNATSTGIYLKLQRFVYLFYFNIFRVTEQFLFKTLLHIYI